MKHTLARRIITAMHAIADTETSPVTGLLQDSYNRPIRDLRAGAKLSVFPKL